jgi:YfiH family protein
MMSMPIESITDESELTRAGFHWREKDNILGLVCTPIEQLGFTNAFSTRLGGVSPMPKDALNLAGFNEDDGENIYENRRRFLSLFDGNWRLASCWQMHTADVRAVKGPDAAQPQNDRGDTIQCDALMTNIPRTFLGVKTADCVPIILADKRTGACAAVHAGWRGTVASIVKQTLGRMADEYGARSNDIRAALGPAALACCYEVGAEVMEAFHKNFSNAGSLFKETREEHALVDLHRANREQLIAAGVKSDWIYSAPLCTMCRTDLFFSYRREKKVHGRVGRLMSVIGRTV